MKYLPQSLQKDNLNSKTWEALQKDTGIPVKMSKNYEEGHKTGNKINYYNLLPGANVFVLTHESRPAKARNQMAELWCLFHILTHKK